MGLADSLSPSVKTITGNGDALIFLTLRVRLSWMGKDLSSRDAEPKHYLQPARSSLNFWLSENYSTLVFFLTIQPYFFRLLSYFLKCIASHNMKY